MDTLPDPTSEGSPIPATPLQKIADEFEKANILNGQGHVVQRLKISKDGPIAQYSSFRGSSLQEINTYVENLIAEIGEPSPEDMVHLNRIFTAHSILAERVLEKSQTKTGISKAIEAVRNLFGKSRQSIRDKSNEIQANFRQYKQSIEKANNLQETPPHPPPSKAQKLTDVYNEMAKFSSSYKYILEEGKLTTGKRGEQKVFRGTSNEAPFTEEAINFLEGLNKELKDDLHHLQTLGNNLTPNEVTELQGLKKALNASLSTLETLRKKEEFAPSRTIYDDLIDEIQSNIEEIDKTFGLTLTQAQDIINTASREAMLRSYSRQGSPNLTIQPTDHENPLETPPNDEHAALGNELDELAREAKLGMQITNGSESVILIEELLKGSRVLSSADFQSINDQLVVLSPFFLDFSRNHYKLEDKLISTPGSKSDVLFNASLRLIEKFGPNGFLNIQKIMSQGSLSIPTIHINEELQGNYSLEGTKKVYNIKENGENIEISMDVVFKISALSDEGAPIPLRYVASKQQIIMKKEDFQKDWSLEQGTPPFTVLDTYSRPAKTSIKAQQSLESRLKSIKLGKESEGLWDSKPEA